MPLRVVNGAPGIAMLYSGARRGESIMSSVQEIEEAIGTLSPREQEEIYAWMDERYARAVDAKVERDLGAGAMDERISDALAERATGNPRAL